MRISVLRATENADASEFGLPAPLLSTSDDGYSSGSPAIPRVKGEAEQQGNVKAPESVNHSLAGWGEWSYIENNYY